MVIEFITTIAIFGFTSATPQFSSELVFPLHAQHNHAPGIVELPDGDLLVSWYRGTGERTADDVAVFGARKKNGQSKWSDAFVMAESASLDLPEVPAAHAVATAPTSRFARPAISVFPFAKSRRSRRQGTSPL